MTYDQIKQGLREAARMVDAGRLAEADEKIRSMAGQGLTSQDMAEILTAEQRAALREHVGKS